jgi:hypothetical protein
MNSREEQFAEFVYEAVAGHRPRNEFERQVVLELRHTLKAYADSHRPRNGVRKKMGERFKSLKVTIGRSLTGKDTTELRRHL